MLLSWLLLIATNFTQAKNVFELTQVTIDVFCWMIIIQSYDHPLQSVNQDSDLFLKNNELEKDLLENRGKIWKNNLVVQKNGTDERFLNNT